MPLYFISMGLYDEKDMSIRALETARGCDILYVEFYTSKLDTDVFKLRDLIGKEIKQLSRNDVEENYKEILNEAKKKKVGLLVGGDCFTATTHISLLLEAEREGIETGVVHGSSIYTAIAETGLFIYKFGRVVSIPIKERDFEPESFYDFLKENKERGLHTLILLESREDGRFLSINEAIKRLIEIEKKRRENVISEDTIFIGVARIGSEKQIIKVGNANELLHFDFGGPQHSLIIPGKLHFIEEEAINRFVRK
ncbi:MAG: diphthine synthase [Candidatus Parvarchaeota archaeon]|nr:diphthine synthase [Candidatus Jingweiarchaeum tengchongense]MCW1298353.1 diphthine synthase [Candidatus Jingweiarchaeum tengchongense]MCW1300345.1 diphthine synthase [Candidatus Jingweiarchaeum tengchongense]MCW1304858.1 diphthine synthase [Candidatus Jingweiarchaeum tengchongense]MCW1305841.1 diphthine synthase [Candidatus Jingweiarchaeum tengchongense]